jgi:glycyl-tRNA synthetase
VWEASGHVAGFFDPLVEDTKTGERYRADHLLKDIGIEADGMSLQELDAAIVANAVKSPKGNELSPSRQFNMMFESRIGATAGPEGKVYLRPETAQGIFVNFKNVVDTMAPKMPFGIAQIGKAFRNEIAPREFLFRVREFEQMEIEYFVKEENWEAEYEKLRLDIQKWHEHIGLAAENIREYEVPANDLAHYSKRTIDFEYNYPGKGFDELAGFAYRTDHDLKNHEEATGVKMRYVPADGAPFIPHVLEPSFGVGRAITAVLCEAYTEDQMNDEVRTYLKLPKHLAPYRVAVSPLLKNKPALVEKAREVFLALKAEFGNVAWDDNGNVGKRYRRQDEIGTPACVVIDFETLGEEAPELADTVTVRDRDTGAQERVAIADLVSYLK